MSTDLTIANSNLPAHLQPAAGVDKEFSGGVSSGFPVLSYRGKVWRVKRGGEEQVYVDTNGDAVQTIHAILIRSNERLSKTHYEGKFNEGDTAKPRCWSSNGIRPDSDVPNPISSLCQGCPMDVWGSRTSDEGKKMKACQDVRRVTVLFSHEVDRVLAGEISLEDAPVMLLRIPPASLNPLKDYAERVLAPKGASPFMLITKIGFDTDASFPRLTFKGDRWLDEKEFGVISELRDSDTVNRILDTSAEHMTEGNTDEGGDAASSESTVKAEAPESAPSGVSAEEQSFSEPKDDDIAPAPAPAAAPAPAPAPAPTRAAAVEEQAAEAATEQPPQPAPQAQAAAPSSPAPASESPAADAEIDDMLSSILD